MEGVDGVDAFIGLVIELNAMMLTSDKEGRWSVKPSEGFLAYRGLTLSGTDHRHYVSQFFSS